jgi:hypothetical protein
MYFKNTVTETACPDVSDDSILMVCAGPRPFKAPLIVIYILFYSHPALGNNSYISLYLRDSDECLTSPVERGPGSGAARLSA